MKLEMVTPSKAYDSGFAEGVDWPTPRIWNAAIEAAAELMEGHAEKWPQLRRLSKQMPLQSAS